MVVCLRRVPEIKERLAFIAILVLLPPLPQEEEQGGRVGGEGVKLHVDEEERYTMVQK